MGSDHAELAESLTELGVLEFTQKHYPRARGLLQQSLAIREKAFGSEHPDTARSLMKYAALLRKNDEKLDAKRIEDRAKEILSASSSLH